MAKSILYVKNHLVTSAVDKIIADLKRKGHKDVRKVDKITEDGRTYHRIRIYK